jgi:hypothetical protein
MNRDADVSSMLLGVMGQPQKPPLQIRAFEHEVALIAEAAVRSANAAERSANAAERSARAAEATQKDIAAMLKLAQHSR